MTLQAARSYAERKSCELLAKSSFDRGIWRTGKRLDLLDDFGASVDEIYALIS